MADGLQLPMGPHVVCHRLAPLQRVDVELRTVRMDVGRLRRVDVGIERATPVAPVMLDFVHERDAHIPIAGSNRLTHLRMDNRIILRHRRQRAQTQNQKFYFHKNQRVFYTKECVSFG